MKVIVRNKCDIGLGLSIFVTIHVFKHSHTETGATSSCNRYIANKINSPNLWCDHCSLPYLFVN